MRFGAEGLDVKFEKKCKVFDSVGSSTVGSGEIGGSSFTGMSFRTADVSERESSVSKLVPGVVVMSIVSWLTVFRLVG